ncbi:solute carrier family 25 member 35 isoform X1 [Polyodon spathula]|uniref:solute carrier family 25 member 35 isoform X1 n=1 Tax=Polyodon spathula TaxID=7913 RepID=UPI001B7E72E5|nr:solute carrier family 25 member 35 isoform X1 [Polyodon spathula]
MDFVLSGAAACGACLFTNPLEVVKTRMQLQGELKAPGSYQVHYRNVFHAFYTIGRVDGLAGLQKGLVPGLLYQFCMNGFRLGSFAIIESAGYIHSEDGRVIPGKSIAAGAIAGVIGAVMGSPVYLGMVHALVRIKKQHGILGLWRGSSAAVPRVTVGSATQLYSFTAAKEFVRDLQVTPLCLCVCVVRFSVLEHPVVFTRNTHLASVVVLSQIVCITQFFQLRHVRQGRDGALSSKGRGVSRSRSHLQRCCHLKREARHGRVRPLEADPGFSVRVCRPSLTFQRPQSIHLLNFYPDRLHFVSL